MTTENKRFVAKNGLDNNNLRIANVADPIDQTDGANKHVVDVAAQTPVEIAGTLISARRTLNFIPGANVDIQYTDNDVLDKLNITINAGQIDVNALPSFGASGENVEFTITQTNHGFLRGNVVVFNGSSYAKANANSNLMCYLVVTYTQNSNSFSALQVGRTNALSNLVPGATYYLSNTVAGTYTNTSAYGFDTPLFIALSNTAALKFDYRPVLGQEYFASRVNSAYAQANVAFATAFSAFSYANTYMANNAEIVSVFPAFGIPGIKLGELNDLLWLADKRFTCSNGYAGLFDGSWGVPAMLPLNAQTVININIAGQAGVPVAGITYPEGDLYVNFYGPYNNYTNIGFRTKQNGVWYSHGNGINIIPTDPNGYKVLRFTVPATSNYLTDLELTVDVDAANNVWIGGMHYFKKRWDAETEPPYFSKYLPTNNIAGVTNIVRTAGGVRGVIQHRLNNEGTSYLANAIGNLLVGKSTDDTWNKFQVLGSANIDGALTANTANIGGKVQLQRIGSDGEVTSLAGGYLRLNAVGSRIYSITDHHFTTGNLKSDFVDLTFSPGISASGNEVMRLTTTGRVGIGTQAPTANLHVVGTSNLTYILSNDATADITANTLLSSKTRHLWTTLQNSDDSYGSISIASRNGGNPDMLIGVYGSARAAVNDRSIGGYFTVEAAENVEIPAIARTTNRYTGALVADSGATTMAAFRAIKQGANLFIIQSNGNVLINKEDDDGFYKLQVNGSINVASNVSINGAYIVSNTRYPERYANTWLLEVANNPTIGSLNALFIRPVAGGNPVMYLGSQAESLYSLDTSYITYGIANVASVAMRSGFKINGNADPQWGADAYYDAIWRGKGTVPQTPGISFASMGYPTGGFYWYANTGPSNTANTPVTMRLSANGNLLLGHDNNDGTAKLNVNGSVVITNGSLTSNGIFKTQYGLNFITLDPASATIRIFNIGQVDALMVANGSGYNLNLPLISSGLIHASGGPLTTGTSSFSKPGGGAVIIRPPTANSGYISWIENGVAVRGQLGFKPASDKLTYSYGGADGRIESGTEALVIATDGSIGIGTNTPASGLDIAKGTSHNYITVRGMHGSGQGQAGIYLYDRTFTQWLITNRNSLDTPANRLAFMYQSGEKVTFTSDGKVGIGTNSPNANLHLVGGAIFSGLGNGGSNVRLLQLASGYANGSGPVLEMNNYSGTLPGFGMYVGNDGVFRIAQNGGGQMTFAGATARLAANSFFAAGPSYEYGPAYILDTTPGNESGIYLPVANSIGFTTNRTERMRIDAGGNVAVGRWTGNTINALFHVKGSSPFFELESTTNGSPRMRYRNSTGAYYFYLDAQHNFGLIDENGGPSRFFIANNTGNFGIGNFYPPYVSRARLDVEGAALIGYNAVTENTVSAPSNGLSVKGSVGIGTTNPTTNLYVQGLATINTVDRAASSLGLTITVDNGHYPLRLTSNTGAAFYDTMYDGSYYRHTFYKPQIWTLASVGSAPIQINNNDSSNPEIFRLSGGSINFVDSSKTGAYPLLNMNGYAYANENILRTNTFVAQIYSYANNGVDGSSNSSVVKIIQRQLGTAKGNAKIEITEQTQGTVAEFYISPNKTVLTGPLLVANTANSQKTMANTWVFDAGEWPLSNPGTQQKQALYIYPVYGAGPSFYIGRPTESVYQFDLSFVSAGIANCQIVEMGSYWYLRSSDFAYDANWRGIFYEQGQSWLNFCNFAAGSNTTGFQFFANSASSNTLNSSPVMTIRPDSTTIKNTLTVFTPNTLQAGGNSFDFHTDVDPVNSTVGALFINPTKTGSPRVFFGNTGMPVYAVNFQYATAVEGMPAFNTRSDTMRWGNELASHFVSRNGQGWLTFGSSGAAPAAGFVWLTNATATAANSTQMQERMRLNANGKLLINVASSADSNDELQIGGTLRITRNTLVANLNADMLDGLEAASFANATFANGASGYVKKTGDTMTGALAAANNDQKLQNWTVLPGGYVEGSTINFRFDQDCLKFVNRWGNGANVMAPLFSNVEVDAVFSQLASAVNLQGKSNANCVVEVTGFSVGSNGNDHFYPFVFLHAGNQYPSVKMEVQKSGAPGVWETAYNGVVTTSGYVIAPYVSATGNLIGVRWTFYGYDDTLPCYIRYMGCISRFGNPYQWTALKGGDVFYGQMSFQYGLSVKVNPVAGFSTSLLGNTWLNASNGATHVLSWDAAYVGAPTVGSRSPGTRMVLWPQVGAAAVDYALGIENNAMWHSVAASTQSFKWYGNTTLLMSLANNNLMLGSNAVWHTGNLIPSDFASAVYANNAFASAVYANNTFANNTVINERVNAAFDQANTANGIANTAVQRVGDTMTGKLTINTAASATDAFEIQAKNNQYMFKQKTEAGTELWKGYYDGTNYHTYLTSPMYFNVNATSCLYISDPLNRYTGTWGLYMDSRGIAFGDPSLTGVNPFLYVNPTTYANANIALPVTYVYKGVSWSYNGTNGFTNRAMLSIYQKQDQVNTPGNIKFWMTESINNQPMFAWFAGPVRFDFYGPINTTNTITATTFTTANNYNLDAVGQQIANNTVEVSRILGANTDDTVAIGGWDISNGAHNFLIAITVSSSNFSTSKTYLVPVRYGETVDVWRKIEAFASAGDYVTNDFSLEGRSFNGSTFELRIRRTGQESNRAGTAKVLMRNLGMNLFDLNKLGFGTRDVFTANSTVSNSVAVPANYWNSAGLSQVLGTLTFQGGKVWHAGNQGAGSLMNADMVDGIHAAQLFNNMGNVYGAWNDFVAIPNFGTYAVLGTANSPNTLSNLTTTTQWYGMTIGVGSDQPMSSFALQLAMPRTSTGGLPYLVQRQRESGNWDSWRKIYAGNADQADNANTVGTYPYTSFANATHANAYFASATYANGNFLNKSTGGTISADVTITGNLIISGMTTYANTSNLAVGDNIITLNADMPNSVPAFENAGIEVNRGANGNTSITWNEAGRYWQANNEVSVYRLANSTTYLQEGANLYYTDARARAAHSNTYPVLYNSSTGVISFDTGTAFFANATHANATFLNKTVLDTKQERLNIRLMNNDTGNDATSLNGLALDIDGAWMRIGDGVTGSKVFANGIGIKFHDSGIAHGSLIYGWPGSSHWSFVTSSGDGNALNYTGVVSLLTLTGTQGVLYAGCTGQNPIYHAGNLNIADYANTVYANSAYANINAHASFANATYATMTFGNTAYANSIFANNINANTNIALGNLYPVTSNTVSTMNVDTGIVSTNADQAMLYDAYITANPNMAGSLDYRDIVYGKVLIGTGFEVGLSQVTRYISFVQESPDPRSLYDSGGSGIVVEALFIDTTNGNNITDRVRIANSANILLTVTGTNPSTAKIKLIRKL